MEDKINNIVELYKKDSNFPLYLTNVLRSLHKLQNTYNKLDSKRENNILIKKLLYIVTNSGLAKHVQQQLTKMLCNITKESVTYYDSCINRYDGTDAQNIDLHIYTITYKLCDISVIIRLEFDINTLSGASIEFGNWLHFVITSRGNELSYYNDRNKREFVSFDKNSMKEFHKKSKVILTESRFYGYLINILIKQIFDEFNVCLNDDLDIHDTIKLFEEKEKQVVQSIQESENTIESSENLITTQIQECLIDSEETK